MQLADLLNSYLIMITFQFSYTFENIKCVRNIQFQVNQSTEAIPNPAYMFAHAHTTNKQTRTNTHTLPPIQKNCMLFVTKGMEGDSLITYPSNTSSSFIGMPTHKVAATEEPPSFTIQTFPS